MRVASSFTPSTGTRTSLAIACAVLALVISLLVLVRFYRPSTPSYHGKPLTYWLEQFQTSFGRGQPSREAEEAIRNIGTNGLPTLIAMLNARDSRAKLFLMSWTSKQKLITFKFTPASSVRYQAQSGYQVLGVAAKAQVFQLTTLLTNANVAGIRQCTASALGFIGEEARDAASALLVTAQDQDSQVRNSSLWALSHIKAAPDLVLPGLIRGLDDSFSIARENAAWALAQYGPIATSAVPALLRREPVNRAAHYALLQIDPEAASRQEPK